jgi:hypothetical protein
MSKLRDLVFEALDNTNENGNDNHFGLPEDVAVDLSIYDSEIEEHLDYNLMESQALVPFVIEWLVANPYKRGIQ